MRKKILINENWKFIKDAANAEEAQHAAGENVQIPHTWNAVDGQDGGNDYYRGTCWYVKNLEKPELNEGEEAWLEFAGVAMTADVYLNGKQLAVHEGGYSIFRVNITDDLEEDNVLAVAVDNSENDHVYPQKADFTFYGGMYRCSIAYRSEGSFRPRSFWCTGNQSDSNSVRGSEFRRGDCRGLGQW